MGFTQTRFSIAFSLPPFQYIAWGCLHFPFHSTYKKLYELLFYAYFKLWVSMLYTFFLRHQISFIRYISSYSGLQVNLSKEEIFRIPMTDSQHQQKPKSNNTQKSHKNVGYTTTADWLTIAIEMVWCNRFTGPQPSNLLQTLCNV